MSSEALFDLLQAPTRWQVVHVAFEDHIFDQLVEPATAEQVAQICGYDAHRTQLFLKALCAMDLVDETADTYQLKAAVSDILRSDSPSSLRSMMLALSMIRHGDIRTLLRKEEPAMSLNMKDPAYWEKAGESLRAFHRGMALPCMLSCLTSLPEWGHVKSVVDLGAGSEILAKAIVTEGSGKNVTIIDLPPLAEVINKRVQSDLECSDRISVRSMNYNQMNFPDGTDLIWASMTLYFAEDLVDVLRRAKEALNPGGVFVSFHEELTDKRTKPECHVVGRLVPALRGQDHSMEVGQVSESMHKAGFKSVFVKPLETVIGSMVLTVGRVS